MKSKKNFSVTQHVGEEDDIDLAPMLALMVTLIPILLLSSAFTPLKATHSKLPQIAEAVFSENSDADKASITILIDKAQTSILWQKGEDQFRKSYNLSTETDQFVIDLESLKDKDPQLVLARIEPSDDVLYDRVHQVVDLVKKPKSPGKTFSITDPSSGKTITSSDLFPVIEFSNLFSGGRGF